MSQSIPIWALSFSYWLHLLATVIWLGGLATVAFLVLPFIQQTSNLDERERILNLLQKYQYPIGWLSLFILIGTGMFQMSEHPAYQGFLAIDNQWAIAILLKHIFILFMIAAMGYLSWFILPGLKRVTLKRKLGKEINLEELNQLRQKEKIMIWTNLILAFFVIVFTAWARSSF